MNPESSTEIIVIRHGETEWNVQRRFQGHGDSPLTELGELQAQAVAESLRGSTVHAIYSSDLPRALRTAEAVARAAWSADETSRPFLTDRRIRERHHGVFEGLSTAEIETRYPGEIERYRAGDPDYAMPEGESLNRRHARVVEFFEEVAARHRGERVVAVTHGGVLDSLFRHVAGVPVGPPRTFELPNAARNVFRREPHRWLLVSWGEVVEVEYAVGSSQGR
jgi:probable phosphoglycerate mutase